jgi:hydroxypyruvate isomerase
MRTAGFELAANVSLLFEELPLLERFRAAAEAGFDSTESWWPFGASASPADAEVEALLGAIEESGVPQSGMNLYAGDMPAGERGIQSHPARREEAAAALDVAVRIARRTGLRACNALYGQRLEGVDPAEQDAVAVENLATAARRLGDLGVTVLIEPLARGLNGPYPLETAADGVRVVERVREASGLDNVGLLFDTFHLASNGEDLFDVIAAHHELIAHVQIADAPGRGEPGTGTVDVPGVVEALWAVGYRGTVAAEYKPTRPTPETLGWIAATPHLAR